MPTVSSQNNLLQNCRWHSFGKTEELEQAAIRHIALSARHAIAQHGTFHIVLAGGSTPQKVYAGLRYIETDWEAWHIYFGDERCLPKEHEERNSRMAALAWLDHVPIPKTQIHPIAAEENPTLAAEKYAILLNKIPQFDLVLLGLGEDGHTASLFPGHELGASVDAADVLLVSDAPKPPPLRISLSAHRLGATQQLIFLVSGKSKSLAVQNWCSGVAIPASFIQPDNGVDIYLDSDLLQGN